MHHSPYQVSGIYLDRRAHIKKFTHLKSPLARLEFADIAV